MWLPLLWGPGQSAPSAPPHVSGPYSHHKIMDGNKIQLLQFKTEINNEDGFEVSALDFKIRNYQF